MKIEYYAACLTNVRLGKIMVDDGFDGAQRINVFLEGGYAAVALPRFESQNRFEVRADSYERLGEYVKKLRDEQG